MAAWSDRGYSGDGHCGTGLPDKPHPDEGISDLNQLDDNETLRLGAFNIQEFEKSKAAKPEVMEVLGKIICTYAVVAIIHEGSNYAYYYSAGTGVTINMAIWAMTFDGDFGATGHVYAIDLQ